MSLKRGEVNALGVLNLRKLEWIPSHFTKMTTNHAYIHIRMLEQWIDYNLKSRYAIRKIMIVNAEKKLVESYEIGFEDPSEVSMLILGCPLLSTRII